LTYPLGKNGANTLPITVTKPPKKSVKPKEVTSTSTFGQENKEPGPLKEKLKMVENGNAEINWML